jgi:hypothetical protein
MASMDVNAKRAAKALDRPQAVIEKHGTEEHRRNLAAVGTARVRDPYLQAAVEGELLAGLAELVEGLLEEREAAESPREAQTTKAGASAAKKKTS